MMMSRLWFVFFFTTHHVSSLNVATNHEYITRQDFAITVSAMKAQITQLTNLTGSLQDVIIMLQKENSFFQTYSTTMQRTISDLQQTVNEQNRTCQRQINKLSADHKTYTERVTSSNVISGNITVMRNELSALISASSIQEQKLHSMRDDMTNIHNEWIALQNTTLYLTARVSTLDQQLQKRSTRGFFTAVNYNSIDNVPDNGIIVFTSLGTHEGNEYNPNTGVFTASNKGTYVFLASLSTQQIIDYTCYIQIVKNGTPLTALYMHVQYRSDSTFVSVLLEIGDKIWLRKYNGTCSLKDMGTFSGFLLYPK